MELQRQGSRPLRMAVFFVATVASMFGATWTEINTGLLGAVPGIEALTFDSYNAIHYLRAHH
jgi:hypothetical protein